MSSGAKRVRSRPEINGLDYGVGEGHGRAACGGTHRRAAALLIAVLLAAPASAGDFTAGSLYPAQSLVLASHSTVAPVSPTVEQFNETPAHIGDAEARDPSIAAALTVNDVFGVAEGRVHEALVSIEVELARAEDPGRLWRDMFGPLAIANDLPLVAIRAMMMPPPDLLRDDGAAVPVALNASGPTLEAADYLLEKRDVPRNVRRSRRHGMQ